MQSRSHYRHQEAVVDVTQQLRADGGMSDLRETDGALNAVSNVYSVCVCVFTHHLGNSTTEVQRVQEVDESWHLLIQTPGESRINQTFIDLLMHYFIYF